MAGFSQEEIKNLEVGRYMSIIKQIFEIFKDSDFIELNLMLLSTLENLAAFCYYKGQIKSENESLKEINKNEL